MSFEDLKRKQVDDSISANKKLISGHQAFDIVKEVDPITRSDSLTASNLNDESDDEQVQSEVLHQS